MIEAAELAGAIKPGPRSLSLPRQHRHRPGLRGGARGYPLILVMPESMSIERRKMLALLGAQLELTRLRSA